MTIYLTEKIAFYLVIILFRSENITQPLISDMWYQSKNARRPESPSQKTAQRLGTSTVQIGTRTTTAARVYTPR